MASIKISESAIKFLKENRTVCTAGQIKDEKDKHFGLWLGAIIHYETHKLILNTPPVFKKKMDAIYFMEEVKAKAKRQVTGHDIIVGLN